MNDTKTKTKTKIVEYILKNPILGPLFKNMSMALLMGNKKEKNTTVEEKEKPIRYTRDTLYVLGKGFAKGALIIALIPVIILLLPVIVGIPMLAANYILDLPGKLKRMSMKDLTALIIELTTYFITMIKDLKEAAQRHMTKGLEKLFNLLNRTKVELPPENESVSGKLNNEFNL